MAPSENEFDIPGLNQTFMAVLLYGKGLKTKHTPIKREVNE